MLVKTSPTEATKQPPDPTNGGATAKVEVVNESANPVPVEAK